MIKFGRRQIGLEFIRYVPHVRISSALTLDFRLGYYSNTFPIVAAGAAATTAA